MVLETICVLKRSEKESFKLFCTRVRSHIKQHVISRQLWLETEEKQLVEMDFYLKSLTGLNPPHKCTMNIGDIVHLIAKGGIRRDA